MPGMPVSEELHGEGRSQRVMVPQSRSLHVHLIILLSVYIHLPHTLSAAAT